MRTSILAILLLLLSCAPRGTTLTIPPPPAGATILVGAGDIADCKTPQDEQTAKLLDSIPGTVFTLGDNAYEKGAPEDYANCYEPTWGRHKARTKPAIGNHEYITPGGKGFFDYFGLERSWYSYDAGPWHVVVLDSNCGKVDCAAQEKWLRDDLAASKAKCTLAYWHHPRWSSSKRAESERAATDGFWRAAAEAKVDLVLTGHDHYYERFAPLDADGKPDPAGVRSIVVGNGGRHLYDFGATAAGSEARNNDTFGVLRLALFSDRYEWAFIPAVGTFTDSGSAVCN